MKNTVYIKSAITADMLNALIRSGKYVKTGDIIQNTNSDCIGKPIEVKTETSVPIITGYGDNVSASGIHFEFVKRIERVADDRLFRWKLCRAVSTDGKRRFIAAVPRVIRQVKHDSINYALPAIRIVAERIASVKVRKEYTVEEALKGFGTDF